MTVVHWPEQPAAESRHVLRFETVAELRARVAAQGPRRWLVRGVWPEGSYGVHAGEPKTQKTWNGLDLAVSVASGTPWLGRFEVDAAGPVVVFAGEGGDGAILRRVDAIAAHKGVDPDGLPFVVCARSPRLSDVGDMSQVADELRTLRPALAVLDPFYLSARGAKPGDMYAMGALLQTAQHVCSDAGCALFVVHHFNRSRDEHSSAARMSGAGPAEWGRVLIGARVVTRHTDPATTQTRVLTELDVIGGEVADSSFRALRTVRAEDPDDLDSPLTYAVTTTDAHDDQPAVTALPGAAPSAVRVYGVLSEAGVSLTVRSIGDRLAEQGRPLKARTIQEALRSLGTKVEGVEIDARGTTEWAVTDPGSGADS